MKQVSLTKGFFSVVDDEDFERLLKYKWHVVYNKSTKSYYARANLKNRKRLYMHRFIMNTSSGMDCDHINHDTLDNRKSNLRNCTRSENMTNRKGLQSNNKTGVTGISKSRNRFRADVTRNRKQYYLGVFSTKEEAQEARERFILLLPV